MTTKESSLKSILTKCNQLHLLSDVPEDKVDAFTAQILKLNKQYPGGLQSYVAKARKLLKDKLEDRNPFGGFVPHVPPGEKIRSNEWKTLRKCFLGRRCALRGGFLCCCFFLVSSFVVLLTSYVLRVCFCASFFVISVERGGGLLARSH